MNNIILTPLLLLSLSLAACSSTPKLNPSAQRVTIGGKAAGNCKAMGDVMGQGKSGNSQEALMSARNDIRNHAAELRANFVELQTNNQSYGNGMCFGGCKVIDLSGVAYHCD